MPWLQMHGLFVLGHMGFGGLAGEALLRHMALCIVAGRLAVLAGAHERRETEAGA